MKVLVTGGAGYIGSHTVVHLAAVGHEPVVLDNFSNAQRSVIGRMEAVAGRQLEVHAVDLRDREATAEVVRTGGFDAVIHFAGLKAVGESVARPLAYYDHNLGATISLLEALSAHGPHRLVFSSSATVYGEHAPVPYHEDHGPLSATNPYGWTKLFQEQMLQDLASAEPAWRIALLRYFNPVGAHPSGTLGEDPQGTPNNLMPLIAQVAVGRRPELSIFGDDYPTADGTCERDYIHVMDLAEGHVNALEHLADAPSGARAWNLGTGRGTSVRAMVEAFERACGRPVPHRVVERRAGDLAAYWADPTRAQTELGWRATRTVDDMCADTWRWQSGNPHGYPTD